MPSNKTKSNYRKKLRSCAMCKPNKMHGADSRTMQQKRADVTYDEHVNSIREQASVD